MTLYVLDTDHLSLYGRNHPVVIARLKSKTQLSTTAINVEEQLRGRLAQVAEAKDGVARSLAYQRLVETVFLLSAFRILPYSPESEQRFQALKRSVFVLVHKI